MTLAIGTAITGMLDHMAFVARSSHNPCSVEPCPPGGGNGFAGGGPQTPPGLTTACENPGAAANNPHCQQTPSGDASSGGTAN